MAENINKKLYCKGWSTKVSGLIRVELTVGDFTFPTRVTTVSAGVRSSQGDCQNSLNTFMLLS